MKLNQKGIIFSLMTLLLIFGVLSLNSTLNDVKRDFELSNSAEILSISNKFNNIERNLVSLKKEGDAKDIFARSLPFEYVVDSNKLFFEMSFPASSSLSKETINILNLSKVFLEDQNYQNVFDGFKTDINLDASIDWVNDTNQLVIEISPICYSFLTDVNYLAFEKLESGECSAPFNSEDIEKINFNVKFNSLDIDYDDITCNGISCSAGTYNPANNNPFFELIIDDSECSDCNIPFNVISAHISPDQNFDITIGCSGTCNSSDIVLTNKELDFKLETTQNNIDLNTNLILNRDIDDVFIRGLTFTVQGNSTIKAKE